MSMVRIGGKGKTDHFFPVDLIFGRKPTKKGIVFCCHSTTLSEALNTLRLSILARSDLKGTEAKISDYKFQKVSGGHKVDFSIDLQFKKEGQARRALEEGAVVFELATVFYENMVHSYAQPEGLILHAGIEESTQNAQVIRVKATFQIEAIKLTDGRSIAAVLRAFA
jgi:hypothetical protein